ncbi:hypothetical protein GGD83_004938 [Rhodoblastus sphagnicola]|nr:hypothetical protein [Rhodoblastus sphagnicola]
MSSIIRRRRGLISAIWNSCPERVDVAIKSSQTGGFSPEASPQLPRSGFVQSQITQPIQLLFGRTLRPRQPKTKRRSCGIQPAHESLLNRHLRPRLLPWAFRKSAPGPNQCNLLCSKRLTANMRAVGCESVAQVYYGYNSCYHSGEFVISARQSCPPACQNSDHDLANAGWGAIALDAERHPAIHSCREASRRVRRAIRDAVDRLSRSSAAVLGHDFIVRLTRRSQERGAVAKEPDSSLATFGVWIYSAGDYRNGAFLQQTVGMRRDELAALVDRLRPALFGLRCEVRECKY